MARVLLIDDSATMRAFVRATLVSASPSPIDAGEPGAARAEQAGGDPLEEVEIVEAATGLEALRCMTTNPYDCVITDLNMPGLSGLDIVSFVRKSDRHRKTAVIVITTEGATRDRERGLALGADAYVVKPFTPEALRAVVCEQLSKRAGRALAGGPSG